MSKRPNATAGPSSSGNAAGKGRIVKTISRTTDLLKQNEGSSRNGKGKEKEILGDMQPAMADAKSLPGVVSVEKFAKVRAMEILAFQNAIKSAELQGNTRVFQSLPRHLRRRAASHNPRRVPARLRSRAAAEIDPGDNIAKKHRKKAKLRAKGNLRGESRTEQLLKRQRNKTWLPTHMYHAKRFHMVNIWGHRLPLTPTLKSFRPAYRASRRKVLAHDASYFGVIEIEGAKSGITALFSRMLGGPFAGSKYDAGSRAVYTELYHANAFPMGLIGPVTLLWHPSGEKAWLRAHPSIYKESFDAIKRAMGELDHVSDMQIHDLREELSSFELVGPEGGRLLKRVFKVCRDEPSRKSFALLGDPSAISEGTVMGFKVYDPRLSFPPKVLRDDSSDGTPSEDGVVRLNAVLPSEELARSALWDADTREQVLRPSVKKSSLDSRRHSLSLPGTRLRPTSKDDRISIIVIASANTYTLLFPRGWSNAILQSIVYTGTLLGGLEERRAQHRESGRPCFPEHYGNVCKAGREYEAAIAQEEQNHWLRRPPGKRDEEPKTWTPAWQDVFGTANASDMSPWLFPPRLMAYADKAEKAINAFRQARKMDPLPEGFSRNALVQVVVRVEDRGSPGLMAEVYALPAKERRNWVEALTSDNQFGRAHDEYSELQRLGEQQPDPAALVGYATTGNFSMARGRGHALATVTLTAWNELTTLAREAGDEGRLLVKVRNRSGRISRLASLRAV